MYFHDSADTAGNIEKGIRIFKMKIKTWRYDDMQELRQALRIRYVKLHFKVQFWKASRLPVNKVSAIRGGIGEMLLRANCIRDRNCTSCDFEQECIVRRTMYSKFDRKPAFVTTGDSAGYVLECENYEEFFDAGDTLEFHLILFGRTIVYFSQFLQAVYQLGNAGIGKEHAMYHLVSVRNTTGKEILDGNRILMEHYEIQTIDDYVRYRLQGNGRWENQIRFKTPVTLKYQGKIQETLTLEAVAAAVFRRLYILDCFEGLDCGELCWQGEYPKVLEENSKRITVCRYSGTQDQKMALGIKGDMQLSGLPQELLQVLLAGEIMHIGKNTSFGFGRYHVR